MNASLHVISDRTRHRLPFFEALCEAAEGGADVIQIREKKAPARETYNTVRDIQIYLHTHQLQTNIFVNDRVDIAIAADLGGVHLAAKSLSIETAAALRRRSRWTGKIGCSVHTLEEAVQAEQAGVDYVTFGHIFPSASHPGVPPRGLDALVRVVDGLTIPVIAIGGIDAANIRDVLATGCSGIALIGAVLDAEDPRRAAYQLKEEMAKSTERPKILFAVREDSLE